MNVWEDKLVRVKEKKKVLMLARTLGTSMEQRSESEWDDKLVQSKDFERVPKLVLVKVLVGW